MGTARKRTRRLAGGLVGAVVGVAGLLGAAAPGHAADPLPITVTASDASMTYGAAAPAVTASYAGFPDGADPSDLASAPTCSVSVSAGTTSCSGAADPRYTFTYVPGVLTVTPAPLTITASSEDWYLDDPLPTPIPLYDGLVDGDTAPATPPTCVAVPADWQTVCEGASDPHYAISYRAGALAGVLLGPPPVAPPSAGHPRHSSVSPPHRRAAAPVTTTVLPNTGNPTNAALAALGLALVLSGAALVRRSTRVP